MTVCRRRVTALLLIERIAGLQFLLQAPLFLPEEREFRARRIFFGKRLTSMLLFAIIALAVD